MGPTKLVLHPQYTVRRYSRNVTIALAVVAFLVISSYAYVWGISGKQVQWDKGQQLTPVSQPLLLPKEELPPPLQEPPPPIPQRVIQPPPPKPQAPKAEVKPKPCEVCKRRTEARIKAMNAPSSVESFALVKDLEQPGQVKEIASILPNPAGQFLENSVLPPRSPYTVQAGAIIPVVLQQQLVSDLHGAVSATVTQDVFDSIHGQHLLIPSGSRLYLLYNAERQEAETRLSLAAKTLYFPDGSSLNLGGMPSLDSEGATGVQGNTDHHIFQRYGTAGVLSLVVGGISLATRSRGGYHDYSPADAGLYGVGNVMGRAVGEDLHRGMKTRPTLTIPAGYQFNVQASADIVLPGPFPFEQRVEGE